jgi:hypothetical protein
MIQIEVEFTIRHTLEEVKDEFVCMGHFPHWRPENVQSQDGLAELSFLEARTISVNLKSENERYAWFVFSMEACGELKNRIVIPNVISSFQDIDNLELEAFLNLCRDCLVCRPETC